MLITPHSLVGATIAVLIPNPVIAIPVATGSHFVLDAIPHWQETLYPYKPVKQTWLRIIIDLSISLFLISMISKLHPNISFIIWITAISSNIPDLDSILLLVPRLLKTKILKKYWDWHCKIQHETTSISGVVTQVIISLFCLFILLK